MKLVMGFSYCMGPDGQALTVQRPLHVKVVIRQSINITLRPTAAELEWK
jgi:hypothetical protein